jgi:hypothetical protein
MSSLIFLVLRLLLVVILYAFVGLVLYTLWNDLRLQSRQLSLPQYPTLILLRMDGETELSDRFFIPEVVVGRDPTCDCCVDEPTVSARHARLAFHHGQWWVDDLRSRNGTFLNQVTVDKPLVITGGDELRCGQVVFTIRLETSEGSEASEV